MSAKPSVAANTKQILTDAFWKLYREKSIDKITVREITQLAGYNRSTFYEYFCDVYDVLQQLENSLMEKLQFGTPALDIMSVDELAAVFEENAEYLSVLFSGKGDISFMFAAREKLKKPFFEAVKKQGKEIDFKTELSIEYHVAGTISSMIHWLHMPNRPSAEKYLETLREINCEAMERLAAQLGLPTK